MDPNVVTFRAKMKQKLRKFVFFQDIKSFRLAYEHTRNLQFRDWMLFPEVYDQIMIVSIGLNSELYSREKIYLHFGPKSGALPELLVNQQISKILRRGPPSSGR